MLLLPILYKKIKNNSNFKNNSTFFILLNLNGNWLDGWRIFELKIILKIRKKLRIKKLKNFWNKKTIFYLNFC